MQNEDSGQRHFKQNWYKEALSLSPIVIFEQDEELRYTNILLPNAGIDKQQILGKTEKELLPPGDVAHLSGIKKSVLETGKPFKEDVRTTISGEAFYYMLTVNPRYDANGRICGIICTSIDITQRKNYETLLRESEQRFRALVNAASFVVYRASPDWKVMYELIGQNFLADTKEANPDWMQEYILSDDQPHVAEVINEAIQKKSIYQLEHRVMKADGTIGWTLSRAIPLLNENDDIFEWFGAASDITERKRAEEMKLRTESLEAANRELESFSYSVAHDLRAPVQTMIGFSQFLMEDYADNLDDTGKEYIGRIQSGAKKMNETIDDMLALSKAAGQEMHFEEINLHDIAWSVVSELRQQQPDRIVKIKIQKELTAPADARLMVIVMRNLIGNAWKFTGKNLSAFIEIGSFKRDDKKVYYVRDNGAGFDKQQAQIIFSPFKRAHLESEFSGTGIGLSIVERVIKRHNGSIWAESDKGKGATFYFTLD